MNTKMVSTLAGVALVFGMSSAQAALWNFTMTGVVTFADADNDYNLSNLSPVSVTGTFDDSGLIGGTGTVSFESGNAYGNTFTLTAGDITFTPDEEILPNIANYPLLTLNAMTIDYEKGGLKFYATDTTTGATFNSYFDLFDGDDTSDNLIGGNWTSSNVTAVPEAETYAMMLAGLGLVGFMGAARRKKLQAAA